MAAADGARPDEAILIIAASEADANLFYATRFLAPDPFVYLEAGGEKLLLMSDLEVDRARATAAVDRVLSLSAYEERARGRGADPPRLLDALDVLLKELDVRRLRVPAGFPLEHADGLRGRGYDLRPKPDPFFEGRLVKSPEEVAEIARVLRETETALEMAVQALREAEIRGDALVRNGEVLTAEALRRLIHGRLLDRDCLGQHTIVAGGDQACDPHERGTGPLRPHAAIILDLFPRSMGSRYFADITRTVVRGRASDAVKRLFDAVLAGQERALSLIRDGAQGAAIHREVCGVFEGLGYSTGQVGGRMQGFFHGTGHGVGLEIHEPPRISKVDATLRTGQVVTVEPGLYYPGVGGVRLEDLVVVTETGWRNLTSYPKFLEL